jgi:hypothetical protein
LDAALRQRVIRHGYWLTGDEMAALLGLEVPPDEAATVVPWRGHRLEPVSRTTDGRRLWRLSPGGADPDVRRFAGAAAREVSAWLPLLSVTDQVMEMPPVLFRAVVGWIAVPLPPWLRQCGWPENGSAALRFVVGPATSLAPAIWAARPTEGDAALAVAIALTDGAGWQCAETGTVTDLRAGDVVMATRAPEAVVATGPAPLWVAGWAVRSRPAAAP